MHDSTCPSTYPTLIKSVCAHCSLQSQWFHSGGKVLVTHQTTPHVRSNVHVFYRKSQILGKYIDDLEKERKPKFVCQSRMNEEPQGYIRCEHFIVTHRTVPFFTRSKIVISVVRNSWGRTDGQTDRDDLLEMRSRLQKEMPWPSDGTTHGQQ